MLKQIKLVKILNQSKATDFIRNKSINLCQNKSVYSFVSGTEIKDFILNLRFYRRLSETILF